MVVIYTSEGGKVRGKSWSRVREGGQGVTGAGHTHGRVMFQGTRQTAGSGLGPTVLIPVQGGLVKLW